MKRQIKILAVIAMMLLIFVLGSQQTETVNQNAELQQAQLVDYMRFAQKQYQGDPNYAILVYARILGYMDAHYPYQKFKGEGVYYEPTYLHSGFKAAMMSDSNNASMFDTPEKSLYWLNEWYKKCSLPTTKEEQRKINEGVDSYMQHQIKSRNALP